MTVPEAPTGGELTAAAAWSQRVRRVGGFIQLAFAAFWLVRGSLSIGRGAASALIGGIVVIVVVVLVYAIRVTSGTGQSSTSADAKRIERSVNRATVIEVVASFALPVIVSIAGHSDWILPSIAITIGPLLLWLDHLVHIPRYQPAGWALTIGPFIAPLAALMVLLALPIAPESKQSSTAAPGWYLDPTASEAWRFWDGRAWTDHTAPMTAAR